jgi:hypothetical protein
VVDLVIADLGMFSIDRKGGAGMSLIELADGVRAKTAAGFKASLVSMPAAADSRTCALSYRGAAGTSCFQQSAPT